MMLGSAICSISQGGYSKDRFFYLVGEVAWESDNYVHYLFCLIYLIY